MLPSLLAILLIEGFITISVEIITMRQLLPFFGGSVVITSIIIGFFLLFLALGYWRGGYCKQSFLKQLRQNFSFSMLWIGIGLSYSFIAVFSALTTSYAALPFFASLTLYLLFFLAPVVYWLGQTIPITTNLFNQNYTVSKISGSALFLSTMGSFLGAIVTSVVLFQYLGVAWTIVINCCLLWVLIALTQTRYSFSWWQLAGLFAALILIKILNVDSENAQFLLTNNYGNFQVQAVDEKSKILRINESNSSLITTDKTAFPYIEFIRHILFKELNLQNKQLLIIGAGGFTLTAAGTHNNQVTYVDIDPDIKDLAEKNFLLQPIKGQFIGEDARQYLIKNHSHYDVIISDVYSHQITIPPSLLTIEYFKQLKDHLNDNGLLIVNIIANPLFQDSFSMRFNNTLRTVFHHCLIIPLDLPSALSNIIYLCPKVSDDKTIYTDNLSSATFDFFTSNRNYERSKKQP